MFDITAKRDAYAVDPLEYKDKDIVSKNDYLVSIGYGSRDALSVWLGGVNSKQTHTAQERELLDFDQPELFLEVVAVGEDGLQHHLSVSKGERIYKTGLSSTGELIDYDYSELAYDLDWKNNNTHQVSLGIAAFKRVGELNSDQGFLWNSQWLWNIKPKFSVLLGYSENQPAAGEEVETPTAINDVTAVLRWKISDRIQLESDYLYSKQKYITQSTGFERDEQWQRWRPLIIVYSGSRYLSARLAGELYSRETGSDFREYKGAGISLMLSLSFW